MQFELKVYIFTFLQTNFESKFLFHFPEFLIVIYDLYEGEFLLSKLQKCRRLLKYFLNLLLHGFLLLIFSLHTLIIFCSFGFTNKTGNKNHLPIGVYGNGFKSGSMRLGKDAMVFTKNGGALSVGLLSQSYLEQINAQAIIVPIVPFNQQNNILFAYWYSC